MSARAPKNKEPVSTETVGSDTHVGTISLQHRIHVELTANLTIGPQKYVITTENIGAARVSISTRVFLNGKILTRIMTPYEGPRPEKRLAELELQMRQQHEQCLHQLKAGDLNEGKTADDFLAEAKVFIRKNMLSKAFHTLEIACEMYPDDPFILTYYASVAGGAGGDVDAGIEAGKRAIELLKERFPQGKSPHFVTFFRNLAAAYMHREDRFNAFQAIQEGIRFTGNARVLMDDMRKLGIRRRPPLPFLQRSNPINKYLGLMLYSNRKTG